MRRVRALEEAGSVKGCRALLDKKLLQRRGDGAG
jgi:hypothetical protein